jgi:hypothetical protein
MAIGCIPFARDDLDSERIDQFVFQLEVDLRNIILNDCLSRRPERRVTADRILSRRWLQEMEAVYPETLGHVRRETEFVPPYALEQFGERVREAEARVSPAQVREAIAAFRRWQMD